MPDENNLALGLMRDDDTHAPVGIMLALGDTQAQLSPEAAIQMAAELVRMAQLISPPRIVLTS